MGLRERFFWLCFPIRLLSVVVAAAADVLVEQQLAGLTGRRRLLRRLTVETVLEDRVDVAVGARAGAKRSRARCLEPLATVAFLQAQNSQAGAVALLGVGAVGKDRLHQRRGLRPHGLSPAH